MNKRKTTELLVGKADRLIRKGTKILQEVTAGEEDSGNSYFDEGPFLGWETQVQSFFERVGRASERYSRKFDECVYNFKFVSTALAILEGLREDLEDGLLERVEELVAADVFDDLLEQAEYLHSQGFKVPAAALAGAVLERNLRSRCVARGIKVEKRDGIGALNQKLRSAQPEPEYTATAGNKISLWGGIRNDADHGHDDNLKDDDVADMLRGIRDFIE